jgi:hypothetical protein
MAESKPAYDRVDDSLGCASDACTKHLLGYFSSPHYASKAAVGLTSFFQENMS